MIPQPTPSHPMAASHPHISSTPPCPSPSGCCPAPARVGHWTHKCLETPINNAFKSPVPHSRSHPLSTQPIKSPSSLLLLLWVLVCVGALNAYMITQVPSSWPLGLPSSSDGLAILSQCATTHHHCRSVCLNTSFVPAVVPLPPLLTGCCVWQPMGHMKFGALSVSVWPWAGPVQASLAWVWEELKVHEIQNPTPQYNKQKMDDVRREDE